MNKKNKKAMIILGISIILTLVIVVGLIVYINNKKYEYNLLEISESDREYYKLEVNGKYGVISKNGECIVEPTYSSLDIPNPTKEIFIVSQDGRNYNAIDTNGNKLFSEYESVEAIGISTISSNIPYEKSVLKYKKAGLYGIMDLSGKEITKNIYNSITNIDYKEGNLKVEQNGEFGVININGTTLIKPEYESIIADGYYNEETKYENAGFVLRIKTDEGYRFGYANKKGKIILDPLYNEVNRIIEYEGEDVYLITAKNGRYGVIKNGKEMLKNEYSEINFASANNLLIVQKDKAQGVIDMNGNNIIPIDYDNIIIGGKYINAKKGEETVIFDENGNNLNTDIISYDQVTDDLAIIIDNKNKYNIVDKLGNKKLKNEYTYIQDFDNKYFIVTKDGKTGIIDSDEKIIVELKYNAIQKIDNTNALQAIIDGRTDIIGEDMKVSEGIQNGNVLVKESYIKLYSETDMKYYNFNGKEISYKEVKGDNKLYASKKNGKWGLVNSNGDVIVNYEYDMVTEQNGNVAGVKQNGKWRIVNTEGKFETDKEYEIPWLDVTFLGKYYKTNNDVGTIIYSGIN